MRVPRILASPDSAGFLGRGAISRRLAQLGMSRFFAATASPASSPCSPELFFARSRVVTGATRIELFMGVGPPTLCAFRLGEPRVLSRDLASPVTQWCSSGVSTSDAAVDPPRLDLAAATAERTCVFHRARTAGAENGLSTRRSPPRTPSTGCRSRLSSGVTALRPACSADRHAAGTPFHPSPLPAPSRVYRAAAQG